LADVLRLLNQPEAAILCGGTDFYPERLYRPRFEAITDISNVDELRGIEQIAAVWRIGAATTWREVHEAKLPPSFDGLRRAAHHIGAAQIQSVGTVGGNLCTASPAGDGIPPLLTLDASVELLSSGGLRVLALEQFITGYRRTALAPGELLTAVLVPELRHDVRGSFIKLGLRSQLVISIAMVAAVIAINNDTITSARIAVGACSPVAQRLYAVEQALVGCVYQREAVQAALSESDFGTLTPIDDVRSTADYRSRVVRQLIADAILPKGA
jgi:CO/xanthine dehydrogenase FAD-binding subunit